jgi:hypothetical protein
MYTTTRIIVLASLAALATVTGCEKAADHTTAAPAPDNTARNKGDSSAAKDADGPVTIRR